MLAPYEMSRLVTAGTHDYDSSANWKILTENYHECYHCPSIHPELCRVSPPKSGENYDKAGTWVGGTMDLRPGMTTMSLDGTSQGVPLRGLDATGLRTVVYVNVFPNILISPHPDYVMVHRLTPLAADRTRIECSWAFAPEATGKPGFDPSYAIDFWDLTNRQDWAACESVQRGLSSPHAVPGPLNPAEDAVYQFVTMIARGYLGEPGLEHRRRHLDHPLTQPAFPGTSWSGRPVVWTAGPDRVPMEARSRPGRGRPGRCGGGGSRQGQGRQHARERHRHERRRPDERSGQPERQYGGTAG